MLNTPYEVTDQQVAQYQRDGHILLKNVLDAEFIPQYLKAIAETVDERNTETRALKDRDTYGMAFLQTLNLWRFSEKVKEFVLAKRFAGIAARLLGVEKVRIYHDQALFKEAGGGITPWHQDQHYWAAGDQQGRFHVDDASGYSCRHGHAAIRLTLAC